MQIARRLRRTHPLMPTCDAHLRDAGAKPGLALSYGCEWDGVLRSRRRMLEKLTRHTATKICPIAFAAMLAMTGPVCAAAAPGACSLMSRAEVKSFSTNAFFDQIPPEEEKIGAGSSCNYAGIFIQIDPFPFATLENMRRGAPQAFEAVPGIGDIAYAHDNKGLYAELFGRVGQHVFTIQMDVGTNETYASTKPRLLNFARALVAKLK